MNSLQPILGIALSSSGKIPAGAFVGVNENGYMVEVKREKRIEKKMSERKRLEIIDKIVWEMAKTMPYITDHEYSESIFKHRRGLKCLCGKPKNSKSKKWEDRCKVTYINLENILRCVKREYHLKIIDRWLFHEELSYQSDECLICILNALKNN